MHNWSKLIRPAGRIDPSPLRAISLVCVFVCAAGLSRAQSLSLPFEWNEAVHALAEKIAPTLGTSHTFAIGVKDVSGSYPNAPTPGAPGPEPVDLKEIARALAEQLSSMGARQTHGAPADSPVQVTISRGVDGYALVAELPGANNQQTIVVAVANPEKLAGPPVAAPKIERKVVWQQSRPILDFAEADADATHGIWYLLEPERIEIYEFSNGAQILHESKTLGRAFASRDPRGRMVLTDATHVTTYLAGMQCEGAFNPVFNVQCAPIPGQQWPMGRLNWSFESPRNYFSGSMTFPNSLERKFPAFYSAASPSPATGGQNRTLWVVAGLDGQAQLFSGTPDPASTFSGWGSDIATLAPACGLQWTVLVTGAGDWTQPDRLQLYEIRGERALALGEPLQVPGPVLALWPADDGKSARVVVRNLETGDYEGSIVSVACSN